MKMQKQKGFTIIEVLVTVIILSIAIWALSALQTMSVGTNYSSHRLTIATILAQDKMEELRTKPWTDAQLADIRNNFTRDTNGDGVADSFDWGQPADHDNSESGAANPIDERGNSIPALTVTTGYRRFWNVADNVPGPNMKTISVRVEWSEKTAHSVTIDTILSES